MRCVLPAIVLVSVMACAPDLPEPDEFGTFHRQLTKQYGRLNSNMLFGESPRLNLEFTGRRWRGLVHGASDSAKAVARFALARIPASWPRPDTIQVRFRIQHLDLVFARSTTWRGDTIAVADL